MSYIYKVRVKFDSTDKFIIDEINREIDLSIRSVPVKGKANKEMINKISKYFEIKPSNIRIIHGLYSKTKIIEII